MLLVCITLISLQVKAAWVSSNTGWPLYMGAFDKCNGTSYTSANLFAATLHNGIIRIAINAQGTPSGSWSKPAIQPQPNNAVTSILNYGSYVYYYSEGVGCFRLSGNGSTAHTVSNNAGLAFIPTTAYLAVINTNLYLLDVENKIIYKKPVLSPANAWTYVPCAPIELLASDITCMKVRGSDMYIGSTNGIYRYFTTTSPATVHTVMSGKNCYRLEALNHNETSPLLTRQILALISNGSSGPHPTAELVRYDYDRLTIPFVYNKISYGDAGSIYAQILPASNTYTERYYCTNKYNSGVPTAFHIGKSIDFSTWVAGDDVGLPGGSVGALSTTYSSFSTFGTIALGTTYLFGQYNGFFYHNPSSTIRKGKIQNENTADAIQIIPNPFVSNIKIVTNSNDPYTVLITDISGRTVFAKQGTQDVLNAALSAETYWSMGSYIVTITNTTTSETIVRKIIKQQTN